MSEPTLTEPVMRAFFAQLQKEAAPVDALLRHVTRPGVRNAVQSGVGAGAGLGLGAGLVGGGVTGGMDAYRASREGGAGVLSSAASGVGGALGGALRGGVRGAAVGAGAGAALGALSPASTIRGARGLAKLDNPLSSFSNFGQRQVHSLTGWRPGGSMKSVERIGAGAAGARRELAEAVTRGADAKTVSQLERGVRASEAAQGAGLTSLPGIAKSVRDRGLLPTLGTGMKAQWESSGPKGKALMVGLPALSVAQAATREREADEGGHGRGESIGRTVGSALGATAAPLSIAGGLALGGLLERAGAATGRGVDKLRGRRPLVPQEAVRPPATEYDISDKLPERVYGTGYSGGVGGLE